MEQDEKCFLGRSTVDNRDLPLSGYVVLDVADEKGVLCASILAELGAEVIKVEPPAGDTARNIGPFYKDIADLEKSLFWYAYNAGKKSITLNIETLDGQEIFRKLVETADFVVESSQPGYMANLGLDYDALARTNPAIIMTSITPFGQDGPYKDYEASDIVLMAMSGLMHMCGDADRPPLRIGIEQAYGHGGMCGALASLIALYWRNITGEGQHVDVSVYECVVWLGYLTVPYYAELKRTIPRAGSKMRLLTVENELVFPCQDGFVVHRVGTGRVLGSQEKRLVELMDKEGRAEDLTQVKWTEIGFSELEQDKLTHWEEVIGKYFLAHTKSELHKMAVEHKIMLTPVFGIGDVCEYEQLQSRKYWLELDHPALGRSVTYPGALLNSSEVAFGLTRCAPTIGEHNEEVYMKQLRLSPEELIRLKQANVI